MLLISNAENSTFLRFKYYTENIALGKVASQSSTCYGGAAGRAVDGNDHTNYYSNSCSHTCDVAPDWWRVDFGVSALVHSVKITNRGKATIYQDKVTLIT